MVRRFVAPAVLALAAALPVVACGGAVAPGDPAPSPTASSTGAGTGSATAPSSTSSPTSRPTTPAPTCDPATCSLPNVALYGCDEGICVPRRCEEGFFDCDGDVWNGCETKATERYADEDGDGHGATTPAMGCAKPGVAYVASHDDCDDTNVLVRPGQTAFFTQPRANGTYDYDCDGTSELRDDRVHAGTCTCDATTCTLDEGWFVEAPACGKTGTFARTPGGLSCVPLREQRGQACR